MAKKEPKSTQPREPFQVVFFQDEESVPLLDWLDQLQPKTAIAKCQTVIELLRTQGNKIRRPAADYLRDGVYELRTKLGRVRYRLLYFFHGRVAVLSHGFAKTESKVPDKEIEIAIANRERFRANPSRHTFQE